MRTYFSKAQCHLRCEKLLRALGFRRLNVIYGLENSHVHLLFEGSMSFTVGKIAVRTCFSKTRRHLRCGNCSTRLFFEGLVSFTVRKIATITSFSKVRCHLRSGKLPRVLVFRRLDAIYGPENCHAHFFEGSMSFAV